MSRPSRATVLLLTLALGGCASGSPDPFAGEQVRSVQVEVVNLNFNDATLHALRVGQRIRLGVVTGAQTETFTLRWPNSLPLRIEIRLLGGQRCITREMPVDPGDHLYLEIPQDLRRDPDCVRR